MSESGSNWPPIITVGTLPIPIIIRDVVLTLIMWTLLAYGILANVDVASEATAFMMGLQHEVTDPVIIPFLGRLERRVWIIAALVAILGVSTLISIRRRNMALRKPQPKALPDSLIAQNLGVSLSDLVELKDRRIMTLDLNDQRKIVRATS